MYTKLRGRKTVKGVISCAQQRKKERKNTKKKMRASLSASQLRSHNISERERKSSTFYSQGRDTSACAGRVARGAAVAENRRRALKKFQRMLMQSLSLAPREKEPNDYEGRIKLRRGKRASQRRREARIRRRNIYIHWGGVCYLA